MNITPIEELKKEKDKREQTKPGAVRKILYSILLFAIVLGSVCLVVFRDQLNLDRLRRMVTYAAVSKSEEGLAGQIEFDANASNAYAVSDSGFLVASPAGAKLYSHSGAQIADIPVVLENPAAQSSKTAVLAYDIGGTQLRVLDKNGVTLSLTTDMPIIDAHLNEKGWLAVTARESGYKSVINVYNQDMEWHFGFKSSSRFISNAAVSPNKKNMAFVTVGLSDNRYESVLQIYRMDMEDAQAAYTVYDDNVYDVFYISDDTICVVCQEKLIFIGSSGLYLGQYLYSNKYLAGYCDTGNETVVLALSKSRAGGSGTLVVLDKNAEITGEIEISDEILSMSAYGKYTAVLTPEGLNIYGAELDYYAVFTSVEGANTVFARNDGSAILVDNNSARFYIP